MEAVKNAFWNLVTLVLAGVVVYLLYARGKLDAYLPAQYVSTVVLARSAQAAPAPAVVKAEPAVAPAPATQVAPPVAQVQAEVPPAPEPTPAPAVEAAPPAPEPVAPVTLASLTPQQIPRQVKILKPMVFPVIVNGRSAGTISAPAGMMVQVVRVQGEKLIVQNGGATKVVDAADTDILQRAQARAR